MKLRFWGCRGSIPRSRPDMMRYGGNTSCIEVRSAGGTVLALDLGSGAQDFGQDYLEQPAAKQSAALITHTHWDHIQGFPFFAPLFVAGSRWDIYGPRGLGLSLRETLAGQMQYTYFPISLDQMAANVHYHDLVEGIFDFGDFNIQTQYLNHPALTLGYRIVADGATLVYATDHEPFEPDLAVRGYSPTSGADDKHVEFIRGADLLIHDAQYLANECGSKKGWGHSSVEYAVDVALAGKVRQLALFHHDPMRRDDELDEMVNLAKARVKKAGGSLRVFAAADRQRVSLEGKSDSRPMVSTETSPAHLAPAVEEQAVLVAISDHAAVEALTETLREDEVRVIPAADTGSVLRTARNERPGLILVERKVQGDGVMELCRRIRDEDRWGKDVPFIIVADGPDAVDEKEARRAGVTDLLIEPFTTAYARTRIRAWLLRAACRWQCAPEPENEEARMAALEAAGILDTPPEERFDRVTRIAADLFEVPIALISLIDRNRQWFKSNHGLDVRETPRDRAFCAHTIQGENVMVVPDTLSDDRFADNPLVTGKPYIRFYAGCPLIMPDGNRFGTLCLLDHRARVLEPRQIRLLRDLARIVEREITIPS